MSSRKYKTSSAIRKSVSSALELERLEDRQYRSGNHDIGINVNDSSAAGVAKAIPILHELGVTSVRLWAGVKDFNNHTMINGLQRAIDYSSAGFDVTLTVANSDKQVPNASEVKSWFQWAVSNPAIKKAVDRWEIGNEVDSNYYFKGSLNQYLSNFLKPAYEGLHAAGETVVSAGVSWNPQDIKNMIDNGLLNYCDQIGFHPYANGVGNQKLHIDQVNAIVAGRKPLIATEWNVRGFESNKTKWAQAVEDAYANVHSGFAIDYYYCLWAVPTPAGPGGLVTESNLNVNQPFWDAFVSASHATSSSNPGTGSNSGGNTPSGVGASISGVLWGDSNANGAMDKNEPTAGGRTVFIDANGDGQLEAGEASTTADSNGHYKFTNLKARTYKVTRLFPDGYKISNSARPYVTATLASSQQVSNLNIGSVQDSAAGHTPTPTPSPTPTPTHTPSPTPTGTTASITGLLWGDSNANGIVDAGEPVANRRIAFIDANGNGKLDKGEITATADAKGVYKFSNLKAGTYKISRVFPEGYKISNSLTADMIVNVDASQQVTGVNIGSIPTKAKPTDGSTGSKLGSISGVVWGDSNNDGILASGEPVGANRIVFIDTNGNGKLDKGEAATKSNAAGQYTFDHLKAGTYKVSRIYPDGYKISNSKLPYRSVTITAGEDLTAINLGSIPAHATSHAA